MIKDYYKILETKQDASDAEIKQAYIKMKNKFDPNNYEKADLKKIATEKTKEIEKAFDEIMNARRLDRIQKGKSTFDTNGNDKSTSYDGENFDLNYIENLINSNNLTLAQNLLDSIGEKDRSPHWFYLKGLLLLKKGWLEEATNFLSAAVRMDPSNKVYSDALRQVKWQRNGNFGNFNQNNPRHSSPYPQTSNCVFCDACMGMMCANAICSCCEDSAIGGC